MTQRKRIILQPEYLKNFHCIGSDCEDSCCIGWRVDLDKKTYLAYKKLNQPELRLTIEKMVNRKHNDKSNACYGKIKMDRNGKCPFLNKENLCKIYIFAGEEYLSNTCTFYPRDVKKIDGAFERSATPSCPEIVRLGILSLEGISFEQVEENAEETIQIHGTFDTQGHLFLNKPQRFFWEIRMFSLCLLQNRDYSLAERLVILGIVYKKIEVIQLEGRVRDIPLMLETMNSMIEAGNFKSELAKIPIESEVQMQVAKTIANHKFSLGISSKRYMECLKETFQGIGFVETDDIEQVKDKYDRNYQEFLRPYLKEKEHILENYLVNEFFKEMMPFGSYQSIWDSYIFLCLLYAMIKFHMIGMAGYHKELNDELVIKIIQSFTKVVLHNNQYIQQIIKLLKDSGYDTLAYMSILVKN
ncbi:flagellin lysine-N-methylase [Dethiobacter alkaliphilus]|uniref:FliB family protein n=1 Tax=Dethiobacter alkaliphilus AHT 1 TaxID=555088 RepID=C0GJJ7_DETAL|nr:flagellin lysine-N-methylase [Dethiobacter alkaliphilus]EEG76544.1 conserved hypothetical protein [Dethiobacter alkaliphilus AHT 1]